MTRKDSSEKTTRFADMRAALGAAARLRIERRLLAAYPRRMVVGDIVVERGIDGSALTHLREQLLSEGLESHRRNGTLLLYAASAAALRELQDFLPAESRARNELIEPQRIVCCQ